MYTTNARASCPSPTRVQHSPNPVCADHTAALSALPTSPCCRLVAGHRLGGLYLCGMERLYGELVHRLDEWRVLALGILA